MFYVSYDPFNSRAKTFKYDTTFRTPSKIGCIYEFKNDRMLTYDKFK